MVANHSCATMSATITPSMPWPVWRCVEANSPAVKAHLHCLAAGAFGSEGALCYGRQPEGWLTHGRVSCIML